MESLREPRRIPAMIPVLPITGDCMTCDEYSSFADRPVDSVAERRYKHGEDFRCERRTLQRIRE